MSSVRFPADIIQSCDSNLNDDLISAYPRSIMRVFFFACYSLGAIFHFSLGIQIQVLAVFFQILQFFLQMCALWRTPEKRKANRLVTLLDVLSLEVACLP